MRAISRAMILLLTVVLTAPIFAAPLQVKLATLDKALEQAQTTAQKERVLRKDVSEALANNLLKRHPQAQVLFNAGLIGKQKMVSCDRENTEEKSYYIIVMEQNKTHYYQLYHLKENGGSFVTYRLQKLQSVSEKNWAASPEEGFEKAKEIEAYIPQLASQAEEAYDAFWNNMLALAQLAPLNDIKFVNEVKVLEKRAKRSEFSPYTELINVKLTFKNGTVKDFQLIDAFPHMNNPYDNELYHFLYIPPAQ